MGKSREKRRRRERKAIRRKDREMFRLELNCRDDPFLNAMLGELKTVQERWSAVRNPESGVNKPITREMLERMKRMNGGEST